jgi:hypothetical protein
MCKNGDVSINWATSSEVNCAYFDIRKSYDLNSWQSIGIIDGYGTTNDMQQYSFNDFTNTDYKSYYQLRQVDHDGYESYSEIISVECMNIADENDIFIVDNEQSIDVIFSNFLDTEFSVYLIDYTGKLIAQKEIYISQENHRMELFSKNLSAGLYNIVFRSAEKVFTKQVISPR